MAASVISCVEYVAGAIEMLVDSAKPLSVS